MTNISLSRASTSLQKNRDGMRPIQKNIWNKTRCKRGKISGHTKGSGLWLSVKLCRIYMGKNLRERMQVYGQELMDCEAT